MAATTQIEPSADVTQRATRKGRRNEADGVSKKPRMLAARDEEHVVSRAPLLLFVRGGRVVLGDERACIRGEAEAPAKRYAHAGV
jgi:hypothetical protein